MENKTVTVPVLSLKECKELGYELYYSNGGIYPMKRCCYYIDENGRRGVCQMKGKVRRPKRPIEPYKGEITLDVVKYYAEKTPSISKLTKHLGISVEELKKYASYDELKEIYYFAKIRNIIRLENKNYQGIDIARELNMNYTTCYSYIKALEFRRNLLGDSDKTKQPQEIFTKAKTLAYQGKTDDEIVQETNIHKQHMIPIRMVLKWEQMEKM